MWVFKVLEYICKIEQCPAQSGVSYYISKC